MMNESDIPNPVAADAPDPEQFDNPEQVTKLRYGHVAVDHDGARYCMECANPEYVKLAVNDPWQIPYGGAVPEGSEVDCPGSACDRCHRHIGRMTLLHYDGVCHPDSCPEMDGWVADL